MTEFIDFPVVAYVDALKYIDGRRDPQGDSPTAPGPQFEEAPVPAGTSVDVLSVVDALVDDIWNRFESEKTAHQKQPDGLEGALCGCVFQHLSGLPVAVLTSVGFWRYLATRPAMFDFIVWRDEDIKQPGKIPGNASFGLTAPNSIDRDTVPWRMFNRALISIRAASTNGTDPMQTAEYVGSEMWKSHIIRKETSFAPVYVAEILSSLQSEDGLKPSDIRESSQNKTGLNFPKRVTRLNTNIVAETLGPDQAARTVRRELDRLREARAAAVGGKGNK